MSEFNQNLFDQLMALDKLAPRIRENYIRSAFGWCGGKYKSLDHILKHFPEGKTFVDGCGGSGVITLNAPDWYQLKVFNDRHSGIIAFYRCIRDRAKMEALVAKLELTLHSREEFIWCRDTWDSCHDDVERAYRWYYMLRMSFSQLGRNFGRATSGMPQQARAIANSLDLFPAIHNRFAMVQIENQDVLQCIRDYDSTDTVFYIDPDYIGTDPGIYEHRVKHIELLDLIEESKGWFAVSGYATKLYDERKWDARHTWDIMVSAKAQAFQDTNYRDKNYVTEGREKKATEVLWIREAK